MAMKGSRLTGTSRVFPAPDPNAPPIVSTKIFSSSSIVEKMMLGCSGCSTLQDIVNLDLSNRRISTLDPSVFSRMSSLVDLNLTNNRLTGFPLSLGLRHLRKLNCDQNLLKSVQTLEQFPNLEELNIDSNELTVADQYIAVYMLPKLKVLNGKEVDLRETIMNMEETLQEQVHILWAESCAPLLKDPMSKAEIQMLETQFIELLKNQVQFGPDALKDFTHHMLTVLAEKCVRQMTAHLRKISEPNATISKVQIVVRSDPTPSKSSSSMSNGVASQAAKAAAAEKRLMQAQASISQEPASKKPKPVQNATPKAPKTPKTTAKRKMIEAHKKVTEPETKETQEVLMEVVFKQEEVEPEPEVEMEIEDSQDASQECGIAYEPVHLLRCHSVDNDPTDAKTNVWKCAFEPNPEVPGASKWTVATCGSNQVCVIDCNSGKVLKKYQHSKDKEEFYCIAWTKLGIITETYRKPTTVLAAAGIRGSIKLLHTTQLMCYAEIKVGGRARPVNCLLFHPQKPTWLFCGAEDIVVIDIGIPHGPDLKIRHKKLFMLEAPGRCLGLVICPKSNFLMAGCDNGCYGWSLDPPKGNGGKRDKEPSMEFLLPSKARILGDEEEMDDDGEKEGDMIDGLALLKDDLIASKVACDGSIHVWSLLQSKKQQKKSGTKEVTIDPLYTLEWCDSDSVYLDIGTWPGCGVLVSGDDQGEVWVYDVSKRNKKKTNKPVKPSQLLPWPENNEGDISDLKPEEGESAEKQEEQKVVEIKDEVQAEEAAPQAQAGEAQGASEVVEVQPEVAKDVEEVVEATAETSASAVANVLEEVVTKVVGEDGQELVLVIREDGQVAATTSNQAVTEKEEEKQEENEEKVEVQQEGAVQKEVETEEVKDEEQKVDESQEKAVTELAEQEQKEGEEEKVQEETEKEKVEEETEKEKVEEETEKEKVEEETEKEKEVSEEKEADTTVEKDTSDEQKEEAKAAAVESTPRRGQRKKIPSVKMEDYIKVEPGTEKKKEVKIGRPEKRKPGRPKKPVSPEEEEKQMEKVKTKTNLLAAGIVRGRGRPKKSEPEPPKKSTKSANKAEIAVKLKQERAAAREEKAQEKAKEKAQRAKDKAQLAEMRQSLKKPKKALMDIANNEDRIIVNDVAISSDCKFIVSVTNKNLICVWQRV